MTSIAKYSTSNLGNNYANIGNFHHYCFVLYADKIKYQRRILKMASTFL